MSNKTRHGCLTSWLIYLIFSYSTASLGIFYKIETITKRFQYITSENLLLIVAAIGLLNVLFSIMILKWVKLGFYGLLATTTLLFAIQIINANNIITPIITAIIVLIVYGLLQLKKKNVSGWANLE